MRCIKDLIESFGDVLDYEVFDVRVDGVVPDLEAFDIFISSGGPGDPREGDGHWDEAYYGWLDAVWENNLTEGKSKKYVLFICHSFQMAVHHFGLAEVGPRRSISFGTFPVHPTKAGLEEPVFAGLDNPFTVADFRRFQVTQPDDETFKEIGAEILGLEKIRPHVDLERAVMAIRWSPEIIGTQFHPEADAEGMLTHFSRPEIKAEVIKDHGRKKWLKLMADLSDMSKVHTTHDTIIPNFLTASIEAVLKNGPLASKPQE
ncbi:GMP synthase [Lewinellaceae bacterium SD302]|nr:GMP synthase [Lewinellaceae bacterium SD302]